jgi:hypothetical protein
MAITRGASAIRFRPVDRGLEVKGMTAASTIVVSMLVAACLFGVGTASAGQQSVPTLSGTVAGYYWTVTVHRGRSPDRPCLRVGMSFGKLGEPAGIGTACGPDEPFPLATSSAANHGRNLRAAIGMVFPPAVAWAKIWLKGRTPRTVHLHLVSENEAKQLGLASLRYGATAYSGRSCLKRIVGYNRDGHRVGSALRVPCG